MASRKQGRKQSRRSARAGKGATQTSMVNALHEVWLAGLGAVVRAQRGAPKLLEELIAEGARFQQDTQGVAEQTFRRLIGDAQARFKAGVGQARGQASDALENLEKLFQSRVHRALTQLGVPSAHELDALGKRVDTLSRNIELLARRSGPAPARAARKAPRRAVSAGAPEPAAAP